jgi:hypothetical protein
MDTYFAEVPAELEAVVALVRREESEECSPETCLMAPALDRCVRDSVAALLDSPIKTFVPLLALRRVRSCIRAGTCDAEEF